MTTQTTQLESLGALGAKRQSWKSQGPRELLKRIVDETGNERDAHEAFMGAIKDNPDMMDAILEYWFANNYRSLTFQIPRHPETINAKAFKEQEISRAAELIKVRAEKMVLLDMMMPNGKTLADCSFREAGRFGDKFHALAKAGRPNEIVGKKLTEADVRKLFR